MDKARLEEFHINNILRAANSLFKKHGYEQTTMDKIAKLAKYSKTTVYAYFNSKEVIFFSLVLTHVEKLLEDFNRVIDSTEDFEETFYKLCKVLVEMEDNYPVYFEGMIGNINMRLEDEETPEVFRKIYDLSDRVNYALFRFFDKGIDKGFMIADIEKEKVALYLWSSVAGIIRMCTQKEDYLMMKSIIREDLFDFSFRAIFKSITKDNLK